MRALPEQLQSVYISADFRRLLKSKVLATKPIFQELGIASKQNYAYVFQRKLPRKR